MLTVTGGQLEAWIAAWLWPFVRVLALFSAAPLFYHSSVPVRVKVALAMVITIVVAPSLPPIPAAADAGWLLVQQLAIGIGIGLALQLMFAAFEVAGDLLGLQMGLSFASFVDPQNAQHSPLLGSFLVLLATLVFLGMNGHLLMIAGISESFRVIPIGSQGPSFADWKGLALLGSEMFRVGLHMALPVLVTLLLMNLALGILSRAAPQLNLLAVGFPATLLVGLTGLALTMPFLGPFIESTLQKGLTAAFMFGR